LFHTSKTAKMIKVILLRAPCQNVNVLLRAEREKSQKVSDSHKNEVSPLTQGLRYRNNGHQTYWGHDLDLSGSRDVIVHVTIRFPGAHFL